LADVAIRPHTMGCDLYAAVGHPVDAAPSYRGAAARWERPTGTTVAGVEGAAPGPVTPCGGCRQKLREFAADDVAVICADETDVRAIFTLGQLLPASFGPEHLQNT